MSLFKDQNQSEMDLKLQDLAVDDAEDQIVVALDFGTTVRENKVVTGRTLLIAMSHD